MNRNAGSSCGFDGVTVMHRLKSNPWIRKLAGVALALLVGELLAPAKANGGCGDYVSVGSESSEHSKPQQTKPGMIGQHQEPAKTPCHGPGCDNHQPPPPAPPTISSVRVQESALLVIIPWANECDPSPYRTNQKNLARIHRSFLIFHPPRPV